MFAIHVERICHKTKAPVMRVTLFRGGKSVPCDMTEEMFMHSATNVTGIFQEIYLYTLLDLSDNTDLESCRNLIESGMKKTKCTKTKLSQK